MIEYKRREGIIILTDEADPTRTKTIASDLGTQAESDAIVAFFAAADVPDAPPST